MTIERREAAIVLGSEEAVMESRPGPSIAHNYECTHDPCVCGTDTLVDDLRETAWFLVGDGDEGGKHYRLDRHNICGRCSGRWPCVEAMIADEARRAADELERLRRWKAEATEVTCVDHVVAAAGRVIDLWLDGTFVTPMNSVANAALLALRRSLGDRWTAKTAPRALADECIEPVDVECTRWNACTDCYTGTEHRPVRVVVTDDATGEELGVQVVHNDYLLICAGNRYLAGTQAHANGTHVLTVKVEGDHG